MEDHMNPAGYVLMADMVCAYIDYIIRHNMRDFDEIGFIGTQLTNHPKEMSEKQVGKQLCIDLRMMNCQSSFIPICPNNSILCTQARLHKTYIFAEIP
jgi:hypothetical protein